MGSRGEQQKPDPAETRVGDGGGGEYMQQWRRWGQTEDELCHACSCLSFAQCCTLVPQGPRPEISPGQGGRDGPVPQAPPPPAAHPKTGGCSWESLPLLLLLSRGLGDLGQAGGQ